MNHRAATLNATNYGRRKNDIIAESPQTLDGLAAHNIACRRIFCTTPSCVFYVRAPLIYLFSAWNGSQLALIKKGH